MRVFDKIALRRQSSSLVITHRFCVICYLLFHSPFPSHSASLAARASVVECHGMDALMHGTTAEHQLGSAARHLQPVAGVILVARPSAARHGAPRWLQQAEDRDERFPPARPKGGAHDRKLSCPAGSPKEKGKRKHVRMQRDDSSSYPDGKPDVLLGRHSTRIRGTYIHKTPARRVPVVHVGQETPRFESLPFTESAGPRVNSVPIAAP